MLHFYEVAEACGSTDSTVYITLSSLLYTEHKHSSISDDLAQLCIPYHPVGTLIYLA